jgi:hypothetical protein
MVKAEGDVNIIILNRRLLAASAFFFYCYCMRGMMQDH